LFCPNCGTENDEAATTCKKCGFNLKGAAAPKFKGTMLMMNSPQQGLPRPPGAPAPGPAAAPPPAPAPAPPAPAMPGPGPGGGARAMLKGTMLGVAPPAMGGHAPPLAAHQPPPAGPQGGFGMAPTPAQPFNAQPPPGAPPAAPHAAQPGVNPLGGTMVADPAGMGFNPYGGGGYGAPPQPGAPAAHQPGPEAGGYGAPPPGGGYGPPHGGAPGFPPPGGGPGFPPPGGGYGPPPGGGYGPPPGQQAHSPGGFGPPPGHGGGFNPPGQGGYGPPQGGYGPPPGGPQAGYAPPQAAYGAPHPGGMPAGGAPIVAASAGGRPLGKTRNPVMTLVFSALCFVYAMIQIWQMANELKAFRGKDDINPLFFFIPILNIIQIWNLAPKLLEAKQMAGVPNPSVQHPVLYLFLGIYFWPADLNEIWQAASGGQAR
jgi:hypothetical protein